MKKLITSLFAIIISTAAFASGLIASISSTTNTCYGTCTGSITGTVSGGTAPYTYSWAGPSSYTGTGGTISNLCAGTYTLTVTDGNSATGTATATITTNTMIIVSVTSPNICAGNIANLMANGATTYTWSAGATSTGVGTATASPTVTTSYTVTGTTLGCSATAVSTVSVRPVAVATFSYTGTPYCQTAANPMPTFSGGGSAGTFSSSAGLVFMSTSTGQVNLSASNSGTYTVTNTVSSSGYCTGSSTSSIIISSPVTPNFTIVPDSVNGYACQIFNSTSGSGLIYSWNFGDGSPLVTTVSPSHIYSAANTDTVTLTVNSTGCVSNSLQHTIIISGIPNSCLALFNVAKDTLSGNPNAYTVTNLSYGSNLTYLWNFGDTTTSTLAHPTHSYLGAGPYQLCLTVNNGTGCTQTYCDSIYAVALLHTHLYPIAITVVNRPAQGTTVGIAESITDNSDIVIAPNPFSNQTVISFSSEQKNTTIKVMDVAGRMVTDKWLLVNGKSTTLDMSSYAKGVYFVQITDVNKNVVNRKIIKD